MRNNLTQKRGLGAVTTTASPWLCHIPDTFPRTPSKWVSSPHLAGKNKSETRWASSCLYSHRNQEKQQGNDCLCAHENLELLHRTKQNSFTIWGSISRWEGLVAIISLHKWKGLVWGPITLVDSGPHGSGPDPWLGKPAAMQCPKQFWGWAWSAHDRCLTAQMHCLVSP